MNSEPTVVATGGTSSVQSGGAPATAGGAPTGDGGVAGSSVFGGAGGSAGTAAPGGAGGDAAEEVDTVLAPGEPVPGGSATRPQLSADDAPAFTVLSYLARAGNLARGLVRDDWDPRAGVGDAASFAPTFVVGSGGTHPSVTEALDAAVALGGSERVFIELLAGTYREVVCVPESAPPITLFSVEADASATTVVFDNYAGKPKPVGQSANPCNPNTSGDTYGTSGSATFAVYSHDFQALNLTFSNDTNESAVSGAVQAVALMIQGDRAVFENVRVLGHQDTLYVKTPGAAEVTRSYFKNCYVEGDVDFIFGRATLVLDGCTIHTLTSRNRNAVIAAPSTDSRNLYGILIANSVLTAEAGTANGSTHLARAWDESQGDVATYTQNVATGVYPNGQALFRECELGAHIAAEPYRAAATTSRPYSSSDQGGVPRNRFYEFANGGPGAAR